MEAKMALIEIVRNFKIELAPETKVLIYIWMECTYQYGYECCIILHAC